LRVVCISDTHGDHQQVDLPEGDVIVHAGDISAHGTSSDLDDFLNWFGKQNFKHKLFIAGNHDTFLEQEPADVLSRSEAANVRYLNDSGIEIDGVRFWGSPITPRFFDWSFMREPGADIDKHWRLIPENTQILVTHGPVWGVLDLVDRGEGETENTGCEFLARRVEQVQPRYHVFGHIHEGYGQEKKGTTTYLNVSTMDKHYRIANAPVVFDYI